jgi:hypothetical protein
LFAADAGLLHALLAADIFHLKKNEKLGKKARTKAKR